MSLADVRVSNFGSAKKKEGAGFAPCPAGKHNAKLIGVVEEETYNMIKLMIDGKQYNFFFNLFIYGTDDLNLDVLNWFKALATIPTNDNTSLLEIINSAIGYTYEVEVYNYTPKTGKNAGKLQDGIQFSTVPKMVTADIEEEDLSDDLPY